MIVSFYVLKSVKMWAESAVKDQKISDGYRDALLNLIEALKRVMVYH